MDLAEPLKNTTERVSMRRGTQRHTVGKGLFATAAIVISVLLGGVSGDKVLRTYFGDSKEIYLEMSTVNSTSINITSIFPRSSWFGFGFGGSMTSAELVMMLASD